MSVFEMLEPICPPSEKGKLVDWVANNLNAKTHLFSSPLELDIAAIMDFAQEKFDKEQEAADAANEALRNPRANNAEDESDNAPPPPQAPKKLAAV